MGKKMDARQYIKIRGANENNLKNIDVDIPRNELVVLTDLAVLENLPLHLIQFMQRVRDVIWNHCLPMQDSSLVRWRNRM